MGSNDDFICAFYFDLRKNFGDILTPYLLRRIFRKTVIHSHHVENANFIGCGSVLERLDRMTEYQKMTIWGSGFMYDGVKREYPTVDFLAVRGKLSASRISYFRGVLGDPGLLVSEVAPTHKKIYEVGFIPHFVDATTELSKYISKLPGVHFININQEPRFFLNEITRCKRVVSSSLHGCIAADSLEIPNLHIMMSKNVLGNNYKFRDYYSAFNFDHRYVDLQKVRRHPRYLSTDSLIAAIDQNYRKPNNLMQIQEDLKRVFREKYD